jgi:hypothetical protein
MRVTSKVILALTILGTLAGWMMTVRTWPELATPQALGGLIMLMVANLGGALGVHTAPTNSAESVITTALDGTTVETKKVTTSDGKGDGV